MRDPTATRSVRQDAEYRFGNKREAKEYERDDKEFPLPDYDRAAERIDEKNRNDRNHDERVNSEEGIPHTFVSVRRHCTGYEGPEPKIYGKILQIWPNPSRK